MLKNFDVTKNRAVLASIIVALAILGAGILISRGPSRQEEPTAAVPPQATGTAPVRFISATSTVPESVPFFAPKSAESVPRGAAYVVQWEPVQYAGFVALDIVLHAASSTATSTVNPPREVATLDEGRYTWKVPADTPPGPYFLTLEAYRIFAKGDIPQKMAEGRSPVFLITR